MSEGNREWERQQEHRATERELQAHFAGRRGALRSHKSLRCRVAGPHGKFDGRLVDLSRSGGLIVIADRRFANGADLEQLMLYTARVWHHFPEGLELQITDRGVSVVANIVRVRVDSDHARFPYQLGVHFRTELTADECDRLGVEDADDRNDECDKSNTVADTFDRLLTSMLPVRDDGE